MASCCEGGDLFDDDQTAVRSPWIITVMLEYAQVVGCKPIP